MSALVDTAARTVDIPAALVPVGRLAEVVAVVDTRRMAVVSFVSERSRQNCWPLYSQAFHSSDKNAS